MLKETEIDSEIWSPPYKLCRHGMSEWLCAHPIYHYPTDEMMDRGQFY